MPQVDAWIGFEWWSLDRWARGSMMIALACLALPCVGTVASAQEPSGLAALAALEDVLVELIARNERSVVSIARIKRRDAGDLTNSPADPFNRFRIGVRDPLDGDNVPDADFIPSDFGTGVVVDSRGLILTNYHVIRADCQHFVTTSERKTYRAKIKAADARSDLAVLEIDAGSTPVKLPPIKFGNAATLKKGQIVISLGNPYAIARDGQASAAWGIVSNLSRKAGPEPEEIGPASGKTTLHHYGTLIQTDAKLNFGTSGGALLNLKGEMVGLTTSLAATAGYEQAAGYAIPADETIFRIVETLKQGREVEYGFLGIEPVNLDPQAILNGKQGMRIEKIVPGMPADRFGLQRDDIITAVNGRRVFDADGLVLEVSRLPVESQARFTVLRDGKVVQKDVELAKSTAKGKRVVTAPAEFWRGLRVDYVSAVVSREFLQPGRNDALLLEGSVAVSEVEEGSPAWYAGLRAEMIISHVGSTRVQTPREFRAAVAGKTGAVQLREVRMGEFRPGISPIERPVHSVEPGEGP